MFAQFGFQTGSPDCRVPVIPGSRSFPPSTTTHTPLRDVRYPHTHLCRTHEDKTLGGAQRGRAEDSAGPMLCLSLPSMITRAASRVVFASTAPCCAWEGEAPRPNTRIQATSTTGPHERDWLSVDEAVHLFALPCCSPFLHRGGGRPPCAMATAAYTTGSSFSPTFVCV